MTLPNFQLTTYNLQLTTYNLQLTKLLNSQTPTHVWLCCYRLQLGLCAIVGEGGGKCDGVFAQPVAAARTGNGLSGQAPVAVGGARPAVQQAMGLAQEVERAGGSLALLVGRTCGGVAKRHVDYADLHHHLSELGALPKVGERCALHVDKRAGELYGGRTGGIYLPPIEIYVCKQGGAVGGGCRRQAALNVGQ